MKNVLILCLILFSENLFAQQNEPAGNIMHSIILFALLFGLMYFLLIRPQTKRAKEHKNLIDNLKINDEVVTNGGILGKIVKINEQFILLETNNDNTITIKKEAISHAMPKGTIKSINQ